MIKKKELIIHIGMYKTGSTSIQESLKSQGQGENYCYFGFRNPNHVQFCKFFMGEKFPFYKKRKTDERRIKQEARKLRKSFIEKIGECDKPIMILSAECSTDMDIVSLKKAKRFFEKYFEKITIFAYIRDPKSYMESAFQQVVKGGKGSFDLGNRYPLYRKRFKKFDKVFGSENVIFSKFSPKELYKGDVVSDFMKRLGLEIDEENLKRVNESMPKEIVALIYLMNKYRLAGEGGPKLVQENNRLNALLKKRLLEGRGEKFKFSEDAVKNILKKHTSDILWMEQRLGEPLILPCELSTNGSEVASEEDLVKIDDILIEKMYKELGLHGDDIVLSDKPESIALLFEKYRKKLIDELEKNK